VHSRRAVCRAMWVSPGPVHPHHLRMALLSRLAVCAGNLQTAQWAISSAVASAKRERRDFVFAMLAHLAHTQLLQYSIAAQAAAVLGQTEPTGECATTYTVVDCPARLMSPARGPRRDQLAPCFHPICLVVVAQGQPLLSGSGCVPKPLPPVIHMAFGASKGVTQCLPPAHVHIIYTHIYVFSKQPRLSAEAAIAFSTRPLSPKSS
jgi:hypothetical protein